jgi:hypothetical protein
MYKYSILFFLFITLFSMTSCEKVIDIKLNEGETKYVIEGELDDTNQPYYVTISQTVGFSSTNQFPTISGALVIIADNTSADTLKEVRAGRYEGNKLRRVQGNTYRLSIKVADQEFTASSTMPQKVNLDSLEITELNFLGNRNKALIPKYKDPVGRGNYYRFIEYINGKRSKAIFVQDDQQNDGGISTRPLAGGDEEKQAGDNVEIEMQCIDSQVYLYFFSLDQLSGGGPNSSATPTNPVANISGGALGYFNAHTSQVKGTRLN